MHRRWHVVVLVLAALLGFLIPLAIAQYVAWNEARNQAVSTLDSLTSKMLIRSEKTRLQIIATLTSLAQLNARAECTEHTRQHMRNMIVTSPYLRAAGFIEGHRLTCSTISNHALSIDASAPELLSEHGLYLWHEVKFNAYPTLNLNFYSFEKEGLGVFVAPELVMDVLSKDAPISLNQVGTQSGQLLRGHGPYDPSWYTRITSGEKTFLTKHHLVYGALAPSGYTLAIGAMPRAELTPFLRHAQLYYLPWGTLVGSLLALLIIIYGRDRLSLKGRLESALKNNELHLVYQPVIDLRTGRCIGAEALVRWRGQNGEMIDPESFIGVAEARGLMRSLTRYVLKQITQDAQPLFAQAPHSHIAINFSAQDFHSPWLLDALTELTESINAQPANIIIEATERGFMDPLKAKPIIRALREKGYKVAIDDFGTGSSSLSYLASYELDILKLDKLFVWALGQDDSANHIARQIIDMAHSLKLDIVAEGVETHLQHSILSEAGVQLAQGYIYSKPITMPELLRLVADDSVLSVPTLASR